VANKVKRAVLEDEETRPEKAPAKKVGPKKAGPKRVDLAKAGKAPDGEEPQEEYDDPPMTIWDHLAELRRRLVICVITLLVTTSIGWAFQADLLAFFAKPYMEAWNEAQLQGDPFNFKSPAEGFLAMFRLSLLGGVALATPIIFWQLWGFIAPGLYKKEKRYVIPFVLSSTLLFVGGGYFGWRLIFPVAFKYLLSFGGTQEPFWLFKDQPVSVHPTVMLSEYIDFVSHMLLGFGAIFEVPLVIFFLSLAGLVNYLQLIRWTRWVIVITFVVAAIITPSPDATSQVMMAVPMLALYGLSILLAYLFGKPPTDAQRQAYKEAAEQRKKEKEADRRRRAAEKAAEKARRARRDRGDDEDEEE
jgi:sec-independent protein translocase protein TatC